MVVSGQAQENAGKAQDLFNNKVAASDYCADRIRKYIDHDTFSGFISSVSDTGAVLSDAKKRIDGFWSQYPDRCL